jgi:hypothetical protein
MPSATAAKEGRKGDTIPLLKGSDFPLKTKSVKIKILDAREAPSEFSSPMILDIEETFGRGAMPVNKTNLNNLVDMLGDDYAKWKGHTITVETTLVRNPKTKQNTRGILVTDAK